MSSLELFALAIFLMLLALFMENAKAGTITPYFELGVYHRDCNLTDSIICDNKKMGSDTPGTIDAGLRVRGCGWWCLGADSVDMGWHHQSYVDRGHLVGSVVEFDGPESQIDMFGARFGWEFNSLQINF